MDKSKLITVAAATTLLVGCVEDDSKQNVIYKDPTPEQIQSAVDEHLAALNKESSDLKEFLEQIQKTDPNVIAARYAMEAEEKVLKVAMNNGDGVTEYTVPVMSGAFAGYVGAALADKIVSFTFEGKDGKPDCDLDDLFEGDEDCKQQRSSEQSVTHITNNYGGGSFVFINFPSYRYETRDSYQTSSRKGAKVYAEQKAKQTARERSKAIQKNKSVTKTSNNKTNSATRVTSPSKPKVSLAQNRQVFSTQGNSARSKGMSSGSSKGWGGGRGFGG